ncbi:hypothetical protein L596_015106 [Steinernema carpocapsae]|uniref:Aminotransferase class V domain-containing protein n=1 Tax=Steinernema carpocapsae TaxID=34508 RepID=A0A4U5NF99_STECR|nr:hypothetical protein L596_015106 [Steinernema carpocapsae]
MRNRFLSNPHSRHSTSQTTTNIVERARIQVLEYFKAQSEYELLFTAGTTQSLKLVAECFDFGGKRSGPTQFLERLDDAQNGTLFGYSTDAHTSVVGMRQVVRSDYVACCYRHEDFLALDGSHRRLIVLTAMSNFCGRKYDLNIINKLQELGNTFVCLDAAALVSCSTLDLSSTRPDFVALSFYKMFGYPTGLGVLLVRKDRCELLEKRFYGGGTVDISQLQEELHRPI